MGVFWGLPPPHLPALNPLNPLNPLNLLRPPNWSGSIYDMDGRACPGTVSGPLGNLPIGPMGHTTTLLGQGRGVWGVAPPPPPPLPPSPQTASNARGRFRGAGGYCLGTQGEHRHFAEPRRESFGGRPPPQSER